VDRQVLEETAEPTYALNMASWQPTVTTTADGGTWMSSSCRRISATRALIVPAAGP
jgi:hypothetical protein